MANLILVRHGESEWNKLGLWTGWTDIPLSQKGKQEAKDAGGKLKGQKIDLIYTSPLKRAIQTADEIKRLLNLGQLETIQDKALNERNYGVYTGKNKWEIQKEVGVEQFKKIRRGWDVPIENGETLQDVYNRTVPYYQNEILPKLKEEKNVLICAHGNSLRALVKYLENISDEDIENLEIPTGEIYIYKLDQNGKIAFSSVIPTKVADTR